MGPKAAERGLRHFQISPKVVRVYRPEAQATPSALQSSGRAQTANDKTSTVLAQRSISS